jgi:RNA polymerase sigma-70 factor (ECF subfamily)
MNAPMAEPDPDRLFRRFLRHRDVAALGELFDFAAPHLARVARHVVHDPSAVEDLVQASFLSALDSAASFDVRRPVMPWLLGILVHHARAARRAAARRPSELAFDPPDPRTPDAEAERREVREAVEQAVSDLPDAYRDVVATWLWEGTPPREIARRAGKPAATVRVELHRGLQLLRQGLPAGMAAMVAGSALGEPSIAAMRARVLARGRELARGALIGSSAVVGGALVSTKIAVGVAVVLAMSLAIGVIATSRSGSPAASVEVSAAAIAESVPGEPREPVDTTAQRTSLDVVAAPVEEPSPRAPAPAWFLVVDVDAEVGSTPARAGTSRSEEPDEEPDIEVTGSHFEIDVSNRFSGWTTPPRSLTLGYDHPQFLRIYTAVDVASQIDLERARSSSRVELHARIAPRRAARVVTGRVTALPDSDLGTAVVFLAEPVGAKALAEHDGATRATTPDELVHCRSDGTFRVRSSSPDAHLLGAVLAGMRPATVEIVKDAPRELDVGEIALDIGEHLGGNVLSGSERHTVSASPTHSDPAVACVVPMPAPPGGVAFTSLVWIGGQLGWGSAEASCDSNGEFRITGLAHVEYRVMVHARSRFPGSFSHTEHDPVTATASCDGLVLDDRASRVRIDVLTDGQPANGATVNLEIDGGGGGGAGGSGNQFEFEWDLGKGAVVRVTKADWAPQEVVIDAMEAERGAVRVVDLHRIEGAGEIVLRPVYSCSEGTGEYVVLFRSRASDDRSGVDVAARKKFAASDSTWSISSLLPGRYRVFARPAIAAAGGWWCRAAPLEIDIGAGGTVVRDLVFEKGGRFAVTVRDDRAQIAGLILRDADLDDSSKEWSFVDPRNGEQRWAMGPGGDVPIGARLEPQGPLAPGRYSFSVTVEGRPRREVPFEIRPGETTEVVVDFSKL